MTNHWSITVSGKKINYNEPNTEENIDIYDIAHALSFIRRWGGMTTVPYSVAEHSLFVAEYLEQSYASTGTVMLGLMHDAAEAYVGDLVTPIKRQLVNYVDLERKITDDITNVLGLPKPGLSNLPEEVKNADGVAMATEFRDLLKANGYWQPDKFTPWAGRKILPLRDELLIQMMFVKKYFKLRKKLMEF